MDLEGVQDAVGFEVLAQFEGDEDSSLNGGDVGVGRT